MILSHPAQPSQIWEGRRGDRNRCLVSSFEWGFRPSGLSHSFRYSKHVFLQFVFLAVVRLFPTDLAKTFVYRRAVRPVIQQYLLVHADLGSAGAGGEGHLPSPGGFCSWGQVPPKTRKF